MAVAVEDRESTGGGSGVGAACREPECSKRLLTERHFGFDEGSEIVECNDAAVWV